VAGSEDRDKKLKKNVCINATKADQLCLVGLSTNIYGMLKPCSKNLNWQLKIQNYKNAKNVDLGIS